MSKTLQGAKMASLKDKILEKSLVQEVEAVSAELKAVKKAKKRSKKK